MQPFFEPENVVVVGASTKPGKAGYSVLGNIVQAMPAGTVWAVHPEATEILGVPCCRAVADVPAQADLAVICLPPNLVLPAVQDCIAAGIKAVIIESGSMAEDESVARENATQLRSLLEQCGHATRVMGPNSIGIVNLRTRLNTSLIPYATLPQQQKPGVAVAGQTGLIASGYLQRICEEGWFHLSKVCCMGNKLDINELDVLEYLKNDADTSVIALYLEDVKNGRAFYSLLRDVVAVKPVVIFKGGSTPQGATAAQSHTGSIAGSGTIFAAAARQAGAILARNFEELFTIAEFLSKAPRPRGNSAGIISITGAGCVLSLDSAAKNGLRVPPLGDVAHEIIDPIVPSWDHVGNPVDLWSSIEKVSSPVAYNVAVKALLANGVDAIVIINLAMPESEFDWEGLSALRDASPGVAIVLCIIGGWPEIRRAWVSRAMDMDFPVAWSPDDALSIIAKVQAPEK